MEFDQLPPPLAPLSLHVNSELPPIPSARFPTPEHQVTLVEVASRVEQDFPEKTELTDLLIDPKREGLLSKLPKTMLKTSDASESFASGSQLVLQQHTGPVKAIYTYDDVALMTHKQTGQEELLAQEFDVSVKMRVDMARKKLNEIMDSAESWQFQSKKQVSASTKEKIERLCAVYESALIAENSNVFNFSTFLNAMKLDKLPISQEDKEIIQKVISKLHGIRANQEALENDKELAEGEAELGLSIAKEVDAALKYIDVEKVKINLNGRIFYKTPRSEGNLSDFIRNNLTEKDYYGVKENYKVSQWQLKKLVDSLDKVLETVESMRMLHGDIKPSSFSIFKNIEKDEYGNDAYVYSMKLTNFGSASFDPYIFFGNPFDVQKSSIKLIQLMLLTAKGYKYPLMPEEDTVFGKRFSNYHKYVNMIERYEADTRSRIFEKEKDHLALFNKASAELESGTLAPTFSEVLPYYLREVSKLEDLKNLLLTPLGRYLYLKPDKENPNYLSQAENREGSFMTSKAHHENTVTDLNKFLKFNLSRKYDTARKGEYLMLDEEEMEKDFNIVKQYRIFAGNKNEEQELVRFYLAF